MDEVNERLDDNDIILSSFIDGAYVEDGVAYFTNNDVVMFSITGIGGGGGGGGGGSVTNATLTVQNTTGWISKTVSTGAACELSFVWSSVEDGMSTGNGTMRIFVNGVTRANVNIAQGNVTRDISEYLSNGTNIVKVQILDVYGQSRTINFNISVMSLSISSSFDNTSAFTGQIQFPYIPVGAIAKTVHFILDGTEIGTQITSISDRQMTYIIPAQSHGGHSLRVYLEAEINGETVRSNELYYEFNFKCIFIIFFY